MRGAAERFQLVDGAQDRAGALGKFLAEAGQPDAAPAALHQRRADQFLQLADLQGQRRLGDGAAFRRAAEMADTGQRLEIAQVFHRQADHKRSISLP